MKSSGETPGVRRGKTEGTPKPSLETICGPGPAWAGFEQIKWQKMGEGCSLAGLHGD